MLAMEYDDQEDIWWYVCTLCHQAFPEDIRLRSHKLKVHGSRHGSNVLILSQIADLQPKVKIPPCSIDLENCKRIRAKPRSRQPEAESSIDGSLPPIENPQVLCGTQEQDPQKNLCRNRSLPSEMRLLPTLKLIPCDGQVKNLRVSAAKTTVGSICSLSQHETPAFDQHSHQPVEGNTVSKLVEGTNSSTRHISKIRPLLCRLCSNRFPTSKRLKEHVLMVHVPHNINKSTNSTVRSTISALVQQEEQKPKTHLMESTTEGLLCSVRDQITCKEELPTHIPQSEWDPEADAYSSGVDQSEILPSSPEIEEMSPKPETEDHDIDRDGGIQCSTCQASFVDEEELLTHEWLTHPFLDTVYVDDNQTNNDDGERNTCNQGQKRTLEPVPLPVGQPVGTSYYLTMEIIKYQRQVDGAVRFYCTLCGRSRVYIADIHRHIREDHDDHECTCPACRRAFDKLSDLNFHFRNEHTVGVNMWSCGVCRMLFGNADDLASHEAELKHANEHAESSDGHGQLQKKRKLLNSGNFRVVAPDNWDLVGHIVYNTVQIHVRRLELAETGQTGIRIRYFCTHCSSSNMYLKDLKYHIRKEHGTGPCTCLLCSTTFSRLLDLEDHTKEAHVEGVDYWSCRICRMIFTAESELAPHANLLHDDMPVPRPELPEGLDTDENPKKTMEARREWDDSLPRLRPRRQESFTHGQQALSSETDDEELDSGSEHLDESNDKNYSGSSGDEFSPDCYNNEETDSDGCEDEEETRKPSRTTNKNASGFYLCERCPCKYMLISTLETHMETIHKSNPHNRTANDLEPSNQDPRPAGDEVVLPDNVSSTPNDTGAEETELANGSSDEDEAAGQDDQNIDLRRALFHRCGLCLEYVKGLDSINRHVITVHLKHIQNTDGGQICHCLLCYKNTFLVPQNNYDGQPKIDEFEFQCKLCNTPLSELEIRIHVRSVHLDHLDQLQVPVPYSEGMQETPSSWRQAKLTAAGAVNRIDSSRNGNNHLMVESSERLSSEETARSRPVRRIRRAQQISDDDEHARSDRQASSLSNSESEGEDDFKPLSDSESEWEPEEEALCRDKQIKQMRLRSRLKKDHVQHIPPIEVPKYLQFCQHDPQETRAPFKCTLCCVSFNEQNILIYHLKENHGDHIANVKRGQIEFCNCMVCCKNALLRPSEATTNAWECKLCMQILKESAVRSHALEYHADYKIPIILPSAVPSEWRAAALTKKLDRISDNGEQKETTLLPTASQSDEKVDTKKRYICRLCDTSYCNRSYFNIHLREVHIQRKELTCPTCSKVFVLERSLRHHMKSVHVESREHLCSECGGAYKTAHMLRIHLLYHDPANRTHVCKVCSKKFFTSSSLHTHLKTHNTRDIMCPECGNMFKDGNAVRAHQRTVHTNVFPYKCDKCDRAFKQLFGLKRHEAAHVEGRPYPCPQCPKAFKSEFHLNDHISLVHTEKRKKVHICRICSQEFPGDISLQRHELEVHNFQRGGTKYECKYCDKKFSVKFNLRQHEVVHTNERRFKCENPGCDKAFNLKGHLRQHKFSHLAYEELAQVCDICGNRFGLASQLRYHKRRIHEKKATRTGSEGSAVSTLPSIVGDPFEDEDKTKD